MMMMMMVPNSSGNGATSDQLNSKLCGNGTAVAGQALPVLSFPELHKKRFHREKKNMKLKMRRSLSAPLNGMPIVSAQSTIAGPSTTATVPLEEAPLSSDRWGSSSVPPKNATTSLPSNALHSAPSLPSRRPGFHDVRKDSQCKVPKRQRSFQDNDSVGMSLTLQMNASRQDQEHRSSLVLSSPPFVRRTKSNAEMVGKIIDQALLELQQ